MNNSDKQRPGIGCLTIIIILIVFVILAMISGGTESEYEKAGNEFETWINEDPEHGQIQNGSILMIFGNGQIRIE